MKKELKKNIKYVFFIIVAVTILNILLVHFEKSVPDTNIHSFIDAIWYMLVTIATIGYGDMVPFSVGGKVIGFFYVFCSFGVIGILIGSISTNISNMKQEKKLGFNGTHFEKHIVFIGWNDFSRMVAEEVSHARKKIAIVTDRKDDVDLIYEEYGKENTFVLFSDYHNFESLGNVNPDKASEVFICFKDDTDTLMYVINFRKKYQKPNIVVSLENHNLKDTFIAAGVTYAIARNEIASKLVASYIFEPDVAEINLDTLSSAKTDDEFDNQEYKIIEKNPYLHMNYLDVFIEMKKKYGCILLGISKNIGNNKRTLFKNPLHEVKIELGDYLIVMVNNAAKIAIQKDFGVEEGIIL